MKLNSLIAVIGAVATAMIMSVEALCLASAPAPIIKVYPESSEVDSLDQITVTIEKPNKFGAFVYMPSLYAVDTYGRIGKEVSRCQLVESSVRGKDTLRFRVLNPPLKRGKYAFLIKDHSFSLIEDGDKMAEEVGTEESSNDIGPRNTVGIFKNYPVDLNRDTLRILHISNSYGGNLLYYVDDLLKAANIDVPNLLIERLVYSGGSFKNWYDVYNDKNASEYWYFKMTGDLDTNISGWEGEVNDGSKFRAMLGENTWDLIILNQASPFAPYHQNWDSTGNGGYLPELLEVVRKYQPTTPIGMLLIHSYAEDYKGNSEHWTTQERWEKIRDGIEWVKSAYNIDFIVPYGTAIENLRLTKYNNAYDLTGDGIHLASGLACYAAGCCYFERVLSHRFNTSVYGNPLRLSEPVGKSTDTYENCIIPVDDEAADIAQKAAFLACQNMFEIRNPDLADLREYRYGEELNQDEFCFEYKLSCSNVNDLSSVSPPYCVYGPTGILIGENMTEDEWYALPEGLYIRNGKKILKVD